MTDKWAALRDHQARVADRRILSLFDADPGRAAGYSVMADGMLFDWSKTNIDAEGRALLVMLAEASDVEGRRAAMFAGEKINDTEGRAVLHVALRAGEDEVIRVEGRMCCPRSAPYAPVWRLLRRMSGRAASPGRAGGSPMW
ncbi:hypothetical protein MASR1M32_30830 [Rhodobacter sp.]